MAAAGVFRRRLAVGSPPLTPASASMLPGYLQRLGCPRIKRRDPFPHCVLPNRLPAALAVGLALAIWEECNAAAGVSAHSLGQGIEAIVGLCYRCCVLGFCRPGRG